MLKIAVKIKGLVARPTSPSTLNTLAVTLGSKNTIFNKNIICPYLRQYVLTSDAPNKSTISSKNKMPMIKTILDTITVKIIECKTALFASSILWAPTYLDINELVPAPIPFPRPMITRYNGEINPSAASASPLIPATQNCQSSYLKTLKALIELLEMPTY